MRSLIITCGVLCSQATMVLCQEYGPVRTYGPSERLYSTLEGNPISRESYLMSERTYRSEDSFGKEGIIRYLFKYANGETETVVMNFFVRCGAVDDSNKHFVRVWANAEDEAQEIKIKNPQDTPSGINKDAYDLFRVVCSPDNATSPQTNGKPVGKPSSDNSMRRLVECCLAYCRAIGCNSPPSTTACNPSFLTSILAKYPEAFPNAAAYRRNLYTGAKSYNGSTIRACM